MFLFKKLEKIFYIFLLGKRRLHLLGLFRDSILLRKMPMPGVKPMASDVKSRVTRCLNKKKPEIIRKLPQK